MVTKIKVMSLVLFCAFIVGGLWVSAGKRLWNDEVFSFFNSVNNISYTQMALAKIPEGNNTPLFYAMQKAWLSLGSYRMPVTWVDMHSPSVYPDFYSNIFLRFWPVVCMSLAVVGVFYFFSRFYSIWLGLYALLVALSTFMVWAYAFEARPYALWFLLTTIQGCLFIRCWGDQKAYERLVPWLILCHVLLALSVVFSLIQISAVCLLLWVLKDRDWRRYIGLWLIPTIMALFYYTHAPKYKFFFVDSMRELISANLPTDRLLILALFGVFWFFNGVKGEAKRLTGAFGGFTLMVLLGCWVVLATLPLKDPDKIEGFRISNRYFICLAPLGIMATTLFSYYLTQAFKGWMRWLVVLALLVFLLWRMYRTVQLIGSLHLQF